MQSILMASLKVIAGEGDCLEIVYCLPFFYILGNWEPEREVTFPEVTTWEQSCDKILIVLSSSSDSPRDCLNPDGNDFVKCNCLELYHQHKIATKDYSWYLELLQ